MFKKYQLTEQERGFWTQHESLENVFFLSIIPRMKAPYWIFYSETYSIKILEREPLKRTRFAFSSFTPLNWDFVLYLGGKRTERFLSELFLPHEKTTCIKAGKTKYAAFGKAGNPRVTGIQTAIKFSVIFPYTKFRYMVHWYSIGVEGGSGIFSLFPACTLDSLCQIFSPATTTSVRVHSGIDLPY